MTTNFNHAGYRLDKLEFFNWGTFNEKVWSLDLNSQTALLTGANGSGKSTILDALITLLVPRISRNYNQAAGNKRERDLKSYVQGAFKQSDNSDSKSEYLRDKKKYTVVLAVFKNEKLDRAITLAHLYWWHGQDLKSLFIIANRQLSISHDFAFANISDFQKILKRDTSIKTFNQFNRYAHQFRKIFGFRSAKAQNLINQIVAMKELGNLNPFIRTHMLESLNVQKHIDDLETSFEDLNATYDAMQKAKDQLELLNPILTEAQSYHDYEQRIGETQTLIDALPYYFAHHKENMLQNAIQEIQTNLERLKDEEKQCNQELNSLREEEAQLRVAAEMNDLKRQLDELTANIKTANQQVNLRKQEFRQYTQLIKPFNVKKPDTVAIFRENHTKFQEQQTDIEAELVQLRDDFVELRNQEDHLKNDSRQLKADIDILRRSEIQIDVRLIELRQNIAQALDIQETDLPFVGELLRVSKSEKRWEAAIERFLRGFGLQLLVPETYYSDVSRYVDETNLKRRIIYNRIQKMPKMPNVMTIDNASIYHKLETKPQTQYEPWLRDKLASNFSYTCCETIDQFQHEVRAITLKGQIKHKGNRHEKDDSHAFGNIRNYVLGWDNKEKIQSMEAELAEVEKNLANVINNITELKNKEGKFIQLRDDVIALLSYDDFEKMDWKSQLEKRDRLDQERRQLEASSDELQQLEYQLKQKKAEVAKKDTESRQYSNTIALHKRDLTQYKADLQEISSMIDLEAIQHYELAFVTITDDLDESPSLKIIDKLQKDQLGFYTRRLSRYRGISGGNEKNIVVMMEKFRGLYPVETIEVDANIASLYWYEELYEQIQTHDLPSHSERFHKYLGTTMATSVNIFLNTLEDQKRKYSESIENLNQSLFNIPYTEATYIRLVVENANDALIRKFQNDLKACLPDSARQDDNLGLEKFEQIRNIIDLLANPDERRWRIHVTDVRNWLDFSAEEIWRDTGEVKEVIRSSSGKSGGQKAKLAYTILASAVAYQFALDEDHKKDEKFRFMMVDEVFSRSDTRNSHFAMKLFESLGLQVLVVTPQKEIQVATPYIGACFVVNNNNDGNYSEVITLSIQQVEDLQLTGQLEA